MQWILAFIGLMAPTMAIAANDQGAAPERRLFQSGERYLIVEVLDDDLVHFELASGIGNIDNPIYTTPMVAKTDYSGPTFFFADRQRVETAEIRVTVSPNLCVTVYDKIRRLYLHTLCPDSLESEWKQISILSPETSHVYGLGQYFSQEDPDGNWIGKKWDPLYDGFGAQLRAFADGATSFSMFPIMYALGEGTSNYALFLDQIYKQMWNFEGSPWTVGAWGDQVRWYVMTGADLPDLRRDYLELTGRPPVPPKRSFGLWVSEFGFRNWSELQSELDHLRSHKFPLEGFALDLQWFGGTFGDPDSSRMGSLTWDELNFPDHRRKIQSLRDQGLNLMLIEEPYVSITLEEHREMSSYGYLAKDCENCAATFLDFNPWWGRGGMVDYTNPVGSDYWHDYRRQALVEAGIFDHWADLGEPEQYNAHAWYYGFPDIGKHSHKDIHNIYGFKWMESIARGYERNDNENRPFLLSRTGTSGIQRFGVGIWSGDIGTNWVSLRSQMNVQMHMSLSGIDYYGSDIGGFQRADSNFDAERLYTQWFAASAALDVPVRPHAWNLDKQRPTSPSRRGDLRSNLENLRLRYRLTPYYYSLAHQAYRVGDPVFPPLVHYFQADPQVRQLGSQKLIGRDLMVALASNDSDVSRNVYLPAGEWIDFHTHGGFFSTGSNVENYPLYAEGHLQLPLFAKAGAIIPMMKIDEATYNLQGKHHSGQASTDLLLKVFANRISSSFDLVEDDGESFGYREGDYSITSITQTLQSDPQGLTATVVVDATDGVYQGMARSRSVILELVTPGSSAIAATLNGQALAPCVGDEPVVTSCYEQESLGTLLIKTPEIPVSLAKHFSIRLTQEVDQPVSLYLVCQNGETQPGTSVYAVGNSEALGNWDVGKAVRLEPSAYPVWTKRIAGLEAGKRLEWKCIKRQEQDASAAEWQGGSNNVVLLPSAGFAGKSVGSF